MISLAITQRSELFTGTIKRCERASLRRELSFALFNHADGLDDFERASRKEGRGIFFATLSAGTRPLLHDSLLCVLSSQSDGKRANRTYHNGDDK